MGEGRLTIGELVARTGVGHRLLRHYEEQGLLAPERTAGGHRLYDPSAVEAVRRIRMLLDAGLPTRVIRQVVPCFDDAGARIDACVAGVLQAHVAALQQRMSDLAAQRSLALQLLPA
ncbi:MerR family transcriptional regulator [Pseudonocardia kunmingensis]|uniref:MerR family transcriptional regulator n=1 Tax=Pseudonocardia kunmingensis TaxID=630975 RepID=A0A543DZU7_9PSEU|nr:MerR family transcriptional regulator [Pseudonocardia kunmingensis]TQM14866.1 MerR family transcriptional regulator [Pseudonocardia kunmingensis]